MTTTTKGITRRDALLGASAVTVATLTGCNATSPLFSAGNSNALTSPSSRVFRASTIDVSTPTGDAIQQAINGLGANGGTINLTSRQPYLISKALTIQSNRVRLIGLGPTVTALVAASGAVLSVPGFTQEFILLVDNAGTISIEQLTIDTINQANGSGPRIGLGVWNSNNVSLTNAAFVRNLGSTGLNTGLAFNGATNVTAIGVKVSESRIGISLTGSSNFTLNQCRIVNCESAGVGTAAGLLLASSDSGVVEGSLLIDNKVNAGVIVSKSADVHLITTKVCRTLTFPSHSLNEGILLENCTGAPIVVSNCTVLSNSGTGIIVRATNKATIRQCTITNNGSRSAGGGVALDGGTQQMSLLSNTISDNRSPNTTGFSAGTSGSDTQAAFEDNSVHGFGMGVDLATGTSKFIVKNNDLRQNTTCSTNNGSNNVVTQNLC